jgi:hypothetical protein
MREGMQVLIDTCVGYKIFFRRRTVKAVYGRQNIGKLAVAEMRHDLRFLRRHSTRKPERVHCPLQIRPPLLILQGQPLPQRRLIHLYMDVLYN